MTEPESRVPVFFYGSFMDAAVLRERGLAPGEGRKARAKGWQLTFAPAPTLTRSFCGVVWGMVYELERADVERLYAQPLHGVTYRPQPIPVSAGGREREATVYVCDPQTAAEPDARAVDAVRAAAAAAGLAPGYVDSIGRVAAP